MSGIHTSADCDEYHGLVRDFGGPRPEIVTLCGSTRFKDEIHAANERLTRQGKLVISLGMFGHTDHPDEDWTTGGSSLKVRLDELHKRKIDLADRVVVVSDESGYFGESTAGEIAYANANGKPVEFLRIGESVDVG